MFNQFPSFANKHFINVEAYDTFGRHISSNGHGNLNCKEEIKKDPSKWQFPDVEFGTDLATEHERWLAEEKFGSCVFVYNYPTSIKAFYMRDNDEDNGETVNAMDLLVPGVGELVGGSQRVSIYFC